MVPTRHEPNALLVGGPSTLPDTERLRCVPNNDDPVKIELGNRYEHFVPTSEITTSGEWTVQVFTWICRTYAAE
ncbi:DUF5988 family protein [Amycolatopsis aidingensis]|uniref:DUF5988 family protein n=1 Tax=Amycolatopsis aidingensis TaxID=2842453 RepID=UPI0038CC03DE